MSTEIKVYPETDDWAALTVIAIKKTVRVLKHKECGDEVISSHEFASPIQAAMVFAYVEKYAKGNWQVVTAFENAVEFMLKGKEVS